MSYVNLVDNPETNTGSLLGRLCAERPLPRRAHPFLPPPPCSTTWSGYTDGASNIWKSIYEENCFKPITQTNSTHRDVLDGTTRPQPSPQA